MEKFRAWTVIVIFILLILYIFRNVIKRIIFFIILLAMAFFIYGLFSPSGADRLWYNIKNIPNIVASFFGGEDFISYDEYQGELPHDEDDQLGNEQSPQNDNDSFDPHPEKEEDADDEDEVFTGIKADIPHFTVSIFLAQRINKIPVVSTSNHQNIPSQDTSPSSQNNQTQNTQTNTPGNTNTNTNTNVNTNNQTSSNPQQGQQTTNNTQNNTNISQNSNPQPSNTTNTTCDTPITSTITPQYTTNYQLTNGLSRAEIEETRRLFDILLE